MINSEGSNVQKKKKIKIPDGDIDFAQAAKLYGYTKARQMLKQISIQQHQKVIDKADEDSHKKMQPFRVSEAIRVSKTLGAPSTDPPIYKILEASSSVNAKSNKQPDVLIVNTENDISQLAKSNVSRIENIDDITTNDLMLLSKKSDNEPLAIESDSYIALKRSMVSGQGEVLLAQYGLESLPSSLGDTLFMQVCHMKSVSLPGNNLRSLFDYHLPQLASVHFRYVRTLNLSGNKLTRLPNDLGQMKSLVSLNLSNNAITKFPMTVRQVTSLSELNLSKNTLNSIGYEFSSVTTITSLNLSDNLFTSIPSPIPKLINLKTLNLCNNMLPHFAIKTPYLKMSDMWHPKINMRNGKTCYMNILTKEIVNNIDLYDGKGIEQQIDIHSFQQNETSLEYSRRKLWLSINQIAEWDPEEDTETGWTFYRNNISGTTQWEMPHTLDSVGKLEALEELNLSNNSIRSIPESLFNLKSLKKLIMNKNKLHDISDNIYKLKRLEILNVNYNEIKFFPPKLCEMPCLQELLVVCNHLVRLPDMLGTMPSLRKIDATANRLTQIPYSLGYSKSLTDILIHENPLTDTPLEEVLKGIDSLKWYLRNKLQISNQGMPPVMEFHQLGLGSEVNIIKPELKERIRSSIAIAEKSGMLSFQLMNIEDIPREVYKLKKLKRLQLDLNTNLRLKDGLPTELSYLKILSFKSCRMAKLPENIDNLKRLVQLNCEVNLFETLPNSITKLKHLTILDVSKNRLYNLPPNFENFVSLKQLNLESNNIEEIPPLLCKLTALVTLNLSRNRLSDIPSTLCQVTGLRKLNLEINRFYSLPAEICHLSLIELKIGNNRIQSLAEDLFAYELGISIKTFSCVGNNLLELPNSLYLIDKESLFETEANPVISPPQILLSEGLGVIQNYLKIRQRRLNEIEELLFDEDFSFVRENAVPQAYEVLEDGTGFLSPEDLAEFDQAIDEYVNGEYYKCPSSGAEIVEKLVQLREYRESEIYLAVLNGFQEILERIKSDSGQHGLHKFNSSLYTNGAIVEVPKPWGRKGEMCQCWAVSLPALLRDLPPSFFCPDGRKSIFNLIKEVLPPMAFPFTVDLLKDSLRLYVSPFGQVAETETVGFGSCECVNDKTNKPVRHSSCIKPAIVLVKSIYSEEEASRREAEEDEYMMRFEEIEEDVRIWLFTTEGKKEIDKEVSVRRARLLEEISLREEMVLMEQFKQKKAKDMLGKLKKRKDGFEHGEDFSVTGFASIADAVRAIGMEEAAIVRGTNREDVLMEKLKYLKDELRVNIEVRRLQVCDDLVQKHCALKYESTIASCRIFANERGLRRPWDGEDGAAFIDWQRLHIAKAGDNENGEGTRDGTTLQELIDKRSEDEGVAAFMANADGPEYDWKGTENMDKYTFPLYSRYENLRKLKDPLGVLFDMADKMVEKSTAGSAADEGD